jgi:hypothetical protein
MHTMNVPMIALHGQQNVLKEINGAHKLAQIPPQIWMTQSVDTNKLSLIKLIVHVTITH